MRKKRVREPDKLRSLDLCFGNPAFLAPYWDEVNLVLPKHGDLAYQHGCGLEPLKKVIRMLHLAVGNVLDPWGYEVVVGNGATQILQAAVHAYSKLGRDLDLVYARPPFFQRFPRLTQMAATSAEWFHRNPTTIHPEDLIEIVTVPNNPDGSRDNGGLPFVQRKIHDLCYFWPQYGEVYPVSEELMVFSLSKATGHASTRIGWALVKHPLIADHMRDFIEHQTSDVSVDSQLRAFVVIEDQVLKASGKQDTVFSYGRAVLRERWARLQPIIDHLGFEVPNREGMFLWGRFRDKKDYAERFLRMEHSVSTFDGEWFGLDGKEWFRANVGCSQADFDEFVRRLSPGRTGSASRPSG